MINKKGYYELLNKIKNTKKDKFYNPKEYKFSLKDFDKKGEKKRESKDSP